MALRLCVIMDFLFVFDFTNIIIIETCLVPPLPLRADGQNKTPRSHSK